MYMNKFTGEHTGEQSYFYSFGIFISQEAIHSRQFGGVVGRGFIQVLVMRSAS